MSHFRLFRHGAVSGENNRMTVPYKESAFFIEKYWLPAPYWLTIGQFDLTEAVDWLIRDPRN